MQKKKAGQWVYADRDKRGRPRERVIDEKLWKEIKENFLRYGICNIYNRERKCIEKRQFCTTTDSCSCCSKNNSKTPSHKSSSSNCSCRGGTNRD